MLEKHNDLYRTAVVDIGSNSIRMVIYQGAERCPAIIFNEKVLAGLGRYLTSRNEIIDESMELGEAALARFALLCREMGIDRIASFATAAVRDASNGAKFLGIAEKCGFAPEILGGEEEAELAGLGVLSAIPEARGVVGDLGGGSLELAYVGDGAVGARYSFPLGVLRLAEMREQGSSKVEKKIRKMIREVEWPESPKGLPLYLVGGSWRSLARLDMHDTEFALPVIHQYSMAPERAAALVKRLKDTEKAEIKPLEGVSTSRFPYLPDAAWLLAIVADELGSQELVASAFGAREGYLYRMLSPEERARDPLLVATDEMGRAEGRFDGSGDNLAAWMAPLFAKESDRERRIRRAACNLADVAWRANPSFRAERGLEIGLHGNWVGITPAEREMLGQALFTSFGGGSEIFPGGGSLAGDKQTQLAISWGMAMRLGQRLGGGSEGAIIRSRLTLSDDALLLELPESLRALYGGSVEKRHQQLAGQFDREPELALV